MAKGWHLEDETLFIYKLCRGNPTQDETYYVSQSLSKVSQALAGSADGEIYALITSQNCNGDLQLAHLCYCYICNKSVHHGETWERFAQDFYESYRNHSLFSLVWENYTIYDNEEVDEILASICEEVLFSMILLYGTADQFPMYWKEREWRMLFV